MGNGGSAWLTSCQLCSGVPTAKHGLKHWATGAFQLTSPTSVDPARTLSVAARRHLINQQGVAVATSERFAFLATGAGNIVQAVVNIVGAEGGADRRGKSAFLVAPGGVP